MKDKLIVALDVNSREQALRLVEQLEDVIGLFKIGMELFYSFGPAIVREIGGERVFLDLKLHDIPHTVAGAARAVAALGVKMFNLHALGGVEMMRAAKEALASAPSPPQVLAVTVLTSLAEQNLTNELKITEPVERFVGHLASLARTAGLDGVVCSPYEIQVVRAICGKDFTIVTPGIRTFGEALDDQKRVMTARQAVQAGADYLVIGRPITRAADPRAAALRIAAELADTSSAQPAA